MQQKVSKFESNKKDIYKNFSFVVNGWSGIVNTQAPNQISDDKGLIITNLLPIGQDLLRKPKAPSLVYTFTNPIVKFYNTPLGNTGYQLAILNDGSLWINGTQIASAGTFSTNAAQIDVAVWKDIAFLIIDANKGYFVYQPNYTPPQTAWSASTAYSQYQIIYRSPYYYITTQAGTSGGTAPAFPTTPGQSVTDGTVIWYCLGWSNNLFTVSTSMVGTSILAWRGRVFISNGNQLNYTAPLSFFDFTANNGGGYMTITSPNLKQQIIKLLSYIDTLYVIGDHAIISITGSQVTNDPSQWYQMEIFNTLGAINRDNVINFNNQIFLTNEYGIWEITSTQSQKLDYAIDITKLSFTGGKADVVQINNLNFYLLPVYGNSGLNTHNFILAYCIDLQSFYYLDFFDTQGVFGTRSISDHSIYAWSGANLYQLFNTNGTVSIYIQTKEYDFEAPTVYKTVKSFYLNTFLYYSQPSWTCQLQSTTFGTTNIYSSNPISFTVLPYNWVNTGIGDYPLSITNSIVPLNIYIAGTFSSSAPLLFMFRTGGILNQFTITETSDALYDVSNFSINGYIGRSIT